MSRTVGILIVMSYLPDYVAVHSFTANSALHTQTTQHKKNSKYFPLSEVIFYLLLNIN